VRVEPSAVVLSEAVQALWERWQAQPRPASEASERRSLFVGVEPVLMMWRSSPERLDGVVARAGSVASKWLSSWKAGGFSLDLLDGEGRVVVGEGSNRAGPRVVRAASDTGLPWTLRVSSADGAGEGRQLAARRNLLLAGLALVAALIGVCSYFIWRAMRRELAAARLQSEFVSAVSHEFRTPLTSMGHLTELLDKGAIVDEGRRREYFSVLARETERLRRLVEGLLNFGRMEAGVLRYRIEPLDLAELTGNVTAEFRSGSPFAGRPIEMKWDGVQVPVRADREAISCALWNLVDNAAKYSPEEAEIVVEITRAGSRAEIHVRDRGPGIPDHEQEEIFRKFVRGAAAKSSGLRGAGIGLAVARHLVRAHGGEILLESAPGQGSVFTIALPLSGRAI
jgi:signal transduction histidine kinase